jgi:hypothetical protein
MTVPFTVAPPSSLVDQLVLYGEALEKQNPANRFLPVLQEAIEQYTLMTVLVEVVRRELGTERLLELAAEVNTPIREMLGPGAPQLVVTLGQVPEDETKR